MMKIAVRYYSKSGNTKKLAEAIAKAVGAAVEPTDTALTEPVDLLFLGGAIYGGNEDGHIRDFAGKLTADTVKSVAVFGTSMSGKSILPLIEGSLSGKGIPVAGSFACKGKFLFINLGRPNDQDCADAAAFARKLIG
jgi:flavodoxin